MRVSVVIPVYNQADLIGRTIEAVVNGTYLPDEVIVVDDGSRDHIQAVIEPLVAQHPCLRLITITHGGPGKARDAGWRAAVGDIIAFTDADAEPNPDWIERGLEGFVSSEVGGVEGAIVCSGTPTIFTHQVRNLFGGHFMTANMFYRRSVISEVGGLKSRYREDSDLAFSVLDAGYQIRFNAASVVSHPPRQETWRFYFHKANRKRFEARLFRSHPNSARHYLPRWQPTELLILVGEALAIVSIWFGVWSLVLGLFLLVVGLPKRIAAWLEGRTFGGKDYLVVWALTLILVPVEAYYHWLGVIRPPRS